MPTIDELEKNLNIAVEILKLKNDPTPLHKALQAMQNSALRAHLGLDERPNIKKAIQLYDKVIEIGRITNILAFINISILEAMVYRAMIYREGEGESNEKPNFEKAKKLLAEAATIDQVYIHVLNYDKNYTRALYLLADMCLKGDGEPNGKPNLDEAMRLCNQYIAGKGQLAVRARQTLKTEILTSMLLDPSRAPATPNDDRKVDQAFPETITDVEKILKFNTSDQYLPTTNALRNRISSNASFTDENSNEWATQTAYSPSPK